MPLVDSFFKVEHWTQQASCSAQWVFKYREIKTKILKPLNAHSHNY